MNESATAILDAAERRIRESGYDGFSFREIAADVGVKSSSVHYHFPKKEQLAAAVAHRYADRFAASVSEEMRAGHTPSEAWRRVFRKAIQDDGNMCLCGALGAAAGALPEEVAVEARRFFQQGLSMLEQSGMSRQEAMSLFASLEGAMLMATALKDVSAFDEATMKIA